MKSTYRIILTVLSFLLANSFLAAPIFVDVNASGNDDGTSWEDAYESLRTAIDEADQGSEIWVKAGTYIASNGIDQFDAIDINFTLYIYGGFDGTEGDINDRNLDMNQSIISGNIGNLNSNTDNLHTLISINGASEVLLNGFVFEDAYKSPSSVNSFRGAIQCEESNLYLQNCIFRNNTAYSESCLNMEDTYLEMENCLLHSNTNTVGGIIHGANSCSMVIINCTLTDNSYNTNNSVFTVLNGSDIKLYNSIIWDGSNPVASASGESYAYNCIVESGEVDLDDFENILITDPLFQDPASQSFKIFDNSPAYNQGDNGSITLDYDLASNPRIIDDQVDIGCYEATQSPPIDGVVYVDINASGNNDGSSWADAYKYLNVALESAADNSEIWIAQGLYLPSTEDINYAYIINQPLKIYGGFNGTETSLDQRNYSQNPTILSADYGVIGDVEDNAHRVLAIANSIPSTIVIDGLIFQDSFFDINNTYNLSGPIYSGSSFILKNSIIRHNLHHNHGGLIFQNYNSPETLIGLIENCEFYDNSARNDVIGSLSGTHLSIVNSTIAKNKSFDSEWPSSSSIFNNNAGYLEVLNSIIYDDDFIYSIISADLVDRCVLEKDLFNENTSFIYSQENPLFNNSGSFDFRINEESPAVGYGKNSYVTESFDLRMNLRIQSTYVDCGANESDFDRLGCSDEEACNFMIQVENDDGSCVFPGCMDAVACNYNPNAGCSDECMYSFCLDSAACNYNPEGICMDNSLCTFPGCTDEMANNYDPNAGCDNDSCLYGPPIIYVDADAQGSETGTNWQNAYNSIVEGLTNAQPGDQIWVAEGVYYTSLSNNPADFINIPNGVEIYGGFNGTESIISQRNWNTNQTILSGDIGQPFIESDNANQMLSFSSGELDTVFDGFVIQDNTDSSVLSAILFDSDNSYLSNCTLKNLKSQIYLCFITPDNTTNIENCLLHSNNAPSNYSLFSLTGNSTLYLLSTTITDINTNIFTATSTAQLYIYNSIIFDNNSIYTELIGFDIETSVIENSCTDLNINFFEFDDFNIFENPIFASPETQNYQLRHDSPCIDAGDESFSYQSFDLKGDERVQGPDMDMGCYEGGTNAVGCLGDANYDGMVDVFDLLSVSSNFGCTGNCTFGDADGNSDVDVFDLLTISSNFGANCSSQ